MTAPVSATGPDAIGQIAPSRRRAPPKGLPPFPALTAGRPDAVAKLEISVDPTARTTGEPLNEEAGKSRRTLPDAPVDPSIIPLLPLPQTQPAQSSQPFPTAAAPPSEAPPADGTPAQALPAETGAAPQASAFAPAAQAGPPALRAPAETDRARPSRPEQAARDPASPDGLGHTAQANVPLSAAQAPQRSSPPAPAVHTHHTAESGQTPGQGASGQSDSRRGDAGARATTTAIGARSLDAGAQLPPFRFEQDASLPEPAAGPPDLAPADGSSAESAQAKDQPLADVVVGLDSERRLDVTISTASHETAERVEAARDELQRDLAALGAEVEAIRVELRSEPAPDAGSPGSEHGLPNPRGQERQAMHDRNDRAGGNWRLAPDTPTNLGANASAGATPGKVDRYA